MTSARSLAASVAALGLATSTLTAPEPAFAAPVPCERAENYAAQSGAELLRINKLEVRAGRPTTKPDRHDRDEESADRPVAGATERVLGAVDDPGSPDPSDSDTLSEGIGVLGQAVLGGLIGRAKGSVEGSPAQDETVAWREGDEPDALKPAGDEPDAEADNAEDDPADDAVEGPAAKKAEEEPKTEKPSPKKHGRDEDDKDADTTTSASVRNIGLGETKTATIGNASINSAAFARVLDAKPDTKLATPLLQQAPPNNAKGASRGTKPGAAGPFQIGAGELGAHARWEPGMACGKTVGEAARSDASIRGAGVLGSALLRVPGKLSSRSTTALERRGEETRTVASATVAAGRIEMAGGKIKVRVLTPPSLTASMSAAGGGKIDYQPAVIEVSGPGVQKRLSAAGEHVDIALTPDRHATESAMLGRLDDLRAGSPLPIPPVPGLPEVSSPRAESTPAAGKVRISLGELRQATKGQAIAAKATAIQVSLAQASKDRGTYGYGKSAPGVYLDLGFGLLEAAAVSPEAVSGGKVSPGGEGGGLPVTGPRVDRLAMAGGALLLAGIGAVLIGLRRRRSHS